MVANQTQSGITQQNYELTQAYKDARGASVDIKTNKDGHVVNLEAWRKGIDIALGLMNANLYLKPSMNVYLEDEELIKRAKAEVHTQELY